MWKVAIEIIIGLALLLYIGNTEISLSPFSFRMNRPFAVAAVVCLLLGIIFLRVDAYSEGIKQAERIATEVIEDLLEEGDPDSSVECSEQQTV